ncbi:DnrP protein [Stutzerimonas urumqiensis]|uniref:DnrP protein n=1 Tax=Stutzerimonas urumqiensis TaxID=638269 RepID=UPI003DA2C251
MPKCLYCQQDNPPAEPECHHCGMPLPALADMAPARKQRRFLWFVVALTVFCAGMIVWLPRSIP